jgi:hypothetical protein
MGGPLLARIALVRSERVIEGFAVDVLGVRGQVMLDGQRKVLVGAVRHRRPLSTALE